MMKVVFRVDASETIGLGHFSRCFNLAYALKQRNADILFVVDSLSDILAAKLKKSDIKYACLNHHSNWDEGMDASKTSDILREFTPKWIIIDHYKIGQKWHEILAPFTDKIMVIDDLVNRKHSCNLILDQNFIDPETNEYENLVPTDCIVRLGTKYALLDSEYPKFRKSATIRKRLNKLLIYFGGTNSYCLTEMALTAAINSNVAFKQIDVVLPMNTIQNEKLREVYATFQNICFHDNLPSLATLIIKADIGVGAAGATSWERCCLGLPTIAVKLADNQEKVASALSAAKSIVYIGNAHDVDVTSFEQAFDFLSKNGNLSKFSKNCFEICDGQGVDRIVADIMR